MKNSRVGWTNPPPPRKKPQSFYNLIKTKVYVCFINYMKRLTLLQLTHCNLKVPGQLNLIVTIYQDIGVYFQLHFNVKRSLVNERFFFRWNSSCNCTCNIWIWDSSIVKLQYVWNMHCLKYFFLILTKPCILIYMMSNTLHCCPHCLQLLAIVSISIGSRWLD